MADDVVLMHASVAVMRLEPGDVILLRFTEAIAPPQWDLSDEVKGALGLPVTAPTGEEA